MSIEKNRLLMENQIKRLRGELNEVSSYNNPKPGKKITNIKQMKEYEEYYANLEGEWYVYELGGIAKARPDREAIWVFTPWSKEDEEWMYWGQAELYQSEVEDEIKAGNIKTLR
tara:strand:+ start:8887 stop:9228 length:342 start_codon:yes stop_codon:yes gene_type:complete